MPFKIDDKNDFPCMIITSFSIIIIGFLCITSLVFATYDTHRYDEYVASNCTLVNYTTGFGPCFNDKGYICYYHYAGWMFSNNTSYGLSFIAEDRSPSNREYDYPIGTILQC